MQYYATNLRDIDGEIYKSNKPAKSPFTYKH